MNKENIGTCELCGATDHHLVMGECPVCRKKCAAMVDAISPTGYNLLARDILEMIKNDDAGALRRIPVKLGRAAKHTLAFFEGLHALTVESCVVRTDEEIDLLGNIFVSHQLLARGILFETFLQDPKATFEAATGRALPLDVDGFLPLLPAQRAAAQRARFEMASDRCEKPIRAVSRPVEDRDLVFLKRQAD